MSLPLDIIPQVSQTSTYADLVASLRAGIAEEVDWNGPLAAPRPQRGVIVPIPGEWEPSSVALSPADVRHEASVEPLGKNASIASTSSARPPEAEKTPQQIALIKRFALQTAARHLLRADHRTQGCLRWRQYGKEDVELWYSPTQCKSSLRNLQTCASVWSCPVCAAKISERRKKELEAALIEAKQRGWIVAMLTTTLRHKRGDALKFLVRGLAEARRKGFSGGAWKKLRDQCGYTGFIRALEVTHGENGWHPHIHELVFFEHDRALGRFRKGYTEAWLKGLSAAGMRDVNDYAVHFTLADCDIVEYIAKFGHDRAWNVEHELTKQVSKIGKGVGGRSPIQLLSDFSFDGDIGAGALWREYSDSFFRCHQLQWSPGFRKSLLGVEAKSDQEVVDEASADGHILALIPNITWQRILADDAVPKLLIVGSSGEFGAVKDFLRDYSVAHDLPDHDPFALDAELLSLADELPLADLETGREIMAHRRIKLKKEQKNQLNVVDVSALWHWHQRGDAGSTLELRRRISHLDRAE